jgi:hypothetical protein
MICLFLHSFTGVKFDKFQVYLQFFFNISDHFLKQIKVIEIGVCYRIQGLKLLKENTV